MNLFSESTSVNGTYLIKEHIQTNANDAINIDCNILSNTSSMTCVLLGSISRFESTVVNVNDRRSVGNDKNIGANSISIVEASSKICGRDSINPTNFIYLY